MSEEKSSGPSAQQVALIQESWAAIYKNKVQNGVDLFIALFTKYPSYKNYFKQFQELSIEELKTAPKMKAHALTLMHALQSWVENLNEPDILAELLRKNAIRHDARGLTKAEFHNLWELLPVYLEATLGAGWTDAVAGAWGALLPVIASVTDGAMDEDKTTKY